MTGWNTSGRRISNGDLPTQPASVVQRLRDGEEWAKTVMVEGVTSRTYDMFMEAAATIERLEAALKIIALRLPDQTLTEPVDWQEVANTFVSVARNALDGTDNL